MTGLRERLWNGEALRILFSEGLGFDVWVEKYANPPRVFCEGQALPMERFDAVVQVVEDYLEQDGVRALWNGQIPTKRETAL
ncbi:MAG: hypothetical protein ACYTDU_16440 [Planctomycetota bacterium]|jgi:hypothetical protein